MWYDLFLKPYEGYPVLFIALEAVAAFFGILSVWFARRNDIWVYPTGIVSTALYVYLLFVSGVYGDAAINIYYTSMSVYGWYTWANTKDGGAELPITRLSRKGAGFTLGFTLVNFSVFYLVLRYYTDSVVPMLDALTTALAFSAMYLMAKKKVENWVFWIVCDVISIVLYVYKGLGVTALQYLVFLAIAISAHYRWVRLYREQRRAAADEDAGRVCWNGKDKPSGIGPCTKR